jgi:hypothetical protein
MIILIPYGRWPDLVTAPGAPALFCARFVEFFTRYQAGPSLRRQAPRQQTGAQLHEILKLV